nr:hypothetical protein [Candidatus Sigynarchaeum springense]
MKADYIKFRFDDKRACERFLDLLVNAQELFDKGRIIEGVGALTSIEKIELKHENPDRDHMRHAAVQLLSIVLPKHPEAISTLNPQVLSMVARISSTFLKEKAYGLLAVGYKAIPSARAEFDEIVDILLGLLKKYPFCDSFAYAIYPLLENLMKILKGTNSPRMADIISYIKKNFLYFEDDHYRKKLIELLESAGDLSGARDLEQSFSDRIETSAETEISIGIYVYDDRFFPTRTQIIKVIKILYEFGIIDEAGRDVLMTDIFSQHFDEDGYLIFSEEDTMTFRYKLKNEFSQLAEYGELILSLPEEIYERENNEEWRPTDLRYKDRTPCFTILSFFYPESKGIDLVEDKKYPAITSDLLQKLSDTLNHRVVFGYIPDDFD